jgi:hypothetical protein
MKAHQAVLTRISRMKTIQEQFLLSFKLPNHSNSSSNPNFKFFAVSPKCRHAPWKSRLGVAAIRSLCAFAAILRDQLIVSSN